MFKLSISIVISKNGKIIFGDKDDFINLDTKNNCAISKIIVKMASKFDLNDFIGKTIKVDIKKSNVTEYRRVERLNNNSILQAVKSGEFIFLGHEFKKLTYVNDINESNITINDDYPLNEDNHTVFLKIRKQN